MDIGILILQLIGTVSFAVSGAMTAMRKGMDLLGVAVLGLTTAVGGGILRDVLLGRTPPAIFSDPLTAALAVGTSVLVFIPAVRRLLSRHGIERVRLLCALQKADLGGKGTGKKADRADAIGALLRLAEELNAREGALTLKQLAVKGNDLMALGYTPGPAIGRCLEHLLALVQDEQIPNEREILLQTAAQQLRTIRR